MFFYHVDGVTCACARELPLPRAQEPAAGAPLVWLYERSPEQSRASFAPCDLRQLSAPVEDVRFLDCSRLESPAPEHPALTAALETQTLRSVNYSHPRWRELLRPEVRRGKKRVNLLAIGDVGSTLLTALVLTGSDAISQIGICDLSEKVTARWEIEMGQVALPWNYDAFPPVRAVGQEELFDCDVFVFIASKGIPPVGSGVRDVRMAQFEANAAIAGFYARKARAAGFRGLYASVSDPVDPLAKTVFLESNRDENGIFDGKGLFPEQIQGFGLGVMNARAAYFAKRGPRFAAFLTEGRSFGPHGEDLVVANSVERYDDALSRELTRLTVEANLEMRALGFKPYVAPALSSGALSLLLTLRGEWHCGSVFLGGVYMGCKNRYTPAGVQTESLALPEPLFGRIRSAADHLAAIV